MGSDYNQFIPGFCTGLFSSLIFNPIDKAIFIATTKNCKIYDKNIWKGMFDGLSITIASRLITSGFYFSFLDFYASSGKNNFEISVLTAMSCSVINPLHIIKFNSWYNNCSLGSSYKSITKTYGFRGLFIGITPLILRDALFNYTYLSLKKDNNEFRNISAIITSLIVVSPLNLIKNKKYASNEDLRSIVRNFKFSQLGISFSLVRTGLSFYLSNYIYTNIKSLL